MANKVLGGPSLLVLFILLLQTHSCAPALPWKLLSGAAAFVLKSSTQPNAVLPQEVALRGNDMLTADQDGTSHTDSGGSQDNSTPQSPLPNGVRKKRRGRPPVHSAMMNTGSLSDNQTIRIDMINMTHAWGMMGCKGLFGDTMEEKEEWDMSYDRLKEYKEKESTCNPPKKSDLGAFLRRQRILYKRGILQAERQKKLVELGVQLQIEGKVCCVDVLLCVGGQDACMCMCAYVCVCVRVCVSVQFQNEGKTHVCVCTRVCMRVCVCTHVVRSESNKVYTCITLIRTYLHTHRRHSQVSAD
jgi:hypothetical protein